MLSHRELQKRQTRHAFFQAVLDLTMQGHAFSSISLRQISREVGVVPTAFYRHFKDMDELGEALVNEELGNALHQLREHLQMGRLRTHEQQIASSVALFFESIDTSPLYWHFIVSERFGGNRAVYEALDAQIRLFVKILSADLRLQPAFGHLAPHVLALIADMGVNMYFSWVYHWLKLADADNATQQAYLQRCTKQAQVVFYGVSNWKTNG
ncbi:MULTISPECIES: TetR family transcriptional regulator [unclassified Moraxella]|uniref:TetR family transcriptional regulator n=1 Tax=unclassified Moraxella TaxID=2685852 RepID=UPI003AF6EC2B